MKDESKKTCPRFEVRKLSTLKAHPDGVRKCDSECTYWLGESHKEFGLLRVPFVLNERTGNLLDGDRMLDALRALGVEEAPVWVVDVPEENEDLAHLAVNNHAGEWQWQLVSEHLKAIQQRGQNLRLTGFHDWDTRPLVAADWTKAQVGPLDGSDPKQGGLF